MNEAMIAYCGLHCGDCLSYKGEIADMARDLRKKLRETKFKRHAAGLTKYFKDFAEYERCYTVLGAMVRLRCRRACRDGGGNPYCKIRACCRKKGIRGCWECGLFETCAKLVFLEDVHADAHLKNLRKLKRQGVEAFLSGKRYW